MRGAPTVFIDAAHNPAGATALAEALDRACARGCELLRVIHGFGTGALRKAVREHLAASPFVRELRPGTPEEGGDGVTLARLG